MGASSSRSPRPSRSESSNRVSVLGPRPPKPDPEELERRFAYVLASMDLPPDKAKLLRNYDDDRKWDLICDQDRVSAKESPQSYLNKIRLYMDPLDPKNAKNLGLKNIGQTSSTKTLKELEISLRTNHIEWVQQFLSEDNNGLDVLVDYLSLTQEHMRLEQEEGVESEMNGGFRNSERALTLRANTIPKRYSTVPRRISTSKVHFGEATDDVHICIMCLRAIMNHQNGFNLIFGHKQAINCIALSLNHRNFRTKTLVLELLAAICLVSGGHEMIMSAFDNFKNVCGETHRFETLVRFFRNFEDFHIDFMVACMQFINIIVHSVQDMNFRVHLQHEFTLLGLDEILDRLKDTESDKLPVQVNAYLENMVDVQSLLEDSDMKAMALMQVEDLGITLSHANERLQELDDLYLSKTAQLQEKLSTVTEDRDRLQDICNALEGDVKRYKDGKVVPSETRPTSQQGSSNVPESPSVPLSPASIPMATPPPPPPLPYLCGGPLPPSLPSMGSMTVPPAPPMLPGFGPPVVAIKKNIQPKYRLPVLNWTAMKPNDVKGTMFSEIDDEKLYKVIDFNEFEECFKIGNLTFDEPDGTILKTTKRPEKTTTTLLESNRVRNIAITRRTIEMTDAEIVRAINGLDLKMLSVERVEILLRIIPNDQEIKAYKEYEKDRKPIDQLADEDKFMMSLMKVERLATKLRIMSFIGNFFETYHNLSPQLNAVYAASKSIRSSQKIKQLFEIILAFGNYMNSCKRGGVYGFKLQSLDMLLETKTSDKKMSLLHFIVKTVREKFKTLSNFEVDLDYIEKAATVSLDNILTDISELEKGMALTKKEYEARKDREPPVVLKDFLNNSEDKLKRLQHDAKNAQDAYTKVVEYFGEKQKTIAPNTFFSLFVRFGKAFKQAETDLENMARLEEALLQKQNVTKQKKPTVKQTQEAVVNELRGKQRQVLNRDEIAHGTLDDLINDIKKNPYRRTDAMRKSVRRNAADNSHQFTTSCPC